MKSLYACGSNLFGHIIPFNDGDRSMLDSTNSLITKPHRVLHNIADARVLYAGLADVLLEYTPIPLPQSPLSRDNNSSSPPVHALPEPHLILRGTTCPRFGSLSKWELTLPPPPSRVSHGFGTSTGEFLGVVTSNHGGVYMLNRKTEKEGPLELEWGLVPDVPSQAVDGGVSGSIVDISIAGNEEIAILVLWPNGKKRGTGKGKSKGEPYIQEPISKRIRFSDSEDRELQDTNEKIYTLQIYSTLDSLLSSLSPSHHHQNARPTAIYPLPPTHTLTSLVSTLTSHAILLQPNPPLVAHSPLLSSQSQSPSQDQNDPEYAPYPLVLTTGDPRHPSLLLHQHHDYQGHDHHHPNSNPTLRPLTSATPLEGLYGLTHLLADPLGWHVAAVDSVGGVYLFGGRSGNPEQGLKDVVAAATSAGNATTATRLSEQEEEPSEHENDDNDVILVEILPNSAPNIPLEIHTISLGTSHLLVLASPSVPSSTDTFKKVFSIGRGQEGQLGAGSTRDMNHWVQMDFNLEFCDRDSWNSTRVGFDIEKIFAGAWGSWIVVAVADEIDDTD